MTTLTYKQAYYKIIDAYFKNEIQPLNANFCFCGTLSPTEFWYRPEFSVLKPKEYPYSLNEYGQMEKALFSFFPLKWSRPGRLTHINPDLQNSNILQLKDYEDRLFNGMCAALEVLKDIHRKRGENVDGETTFTKRQLQPH